MASTFQICAIVAVVVIILILVFHLGRDTAPRSGSRTISTFDLDRTSEKSRSNSGTVPVLPYPRQHPVLRYQRAASLDNHPANWGDPIRPMNPLGGPDYGGNYVQTGSRDNASAYGPEFYGPVPGMPVGVPVPRNSLKTTSEEYRYPFHYQQKPLPPFTYYNPYGPNQHRMQRNIAYADTPFYERTDDVMPPPYNIRAPANAKHYATPARRGYFPSGAAVPMIGSVDAYHPAPEVKAAWEKIGIVKTKDRTDDTILNLYRKPIAPLQDLFQYSVQDKNGFIILLRNISFLEDGDTIHKITGYESKGPWKVENYVGDKWVWV